MTQILLQYGKHKPDGEACLIERLRIEAGQPWDDQGWAAGVPEWAAAIGRALNDAYGPGNEADSRRTAALWSHRHRFLSALPQLARVRLYALADLAIRVIASDALEFVGLHAQAEQLRNLGRVINQASAQAAVRATAVAASAAYDAASFAAARMATYAAAAAADAAYAAEIAVDSICAAYTAEIAVDSICAAYAYATTFAIARAEDAGASWDYLDRIIPRILDAAFEDTK